MFLFTNYKYWILWHAIFEEAFSVKGGNFEEHIFVKCPQNITIYFILFFDGQNDI